MLTYVQEAEATKSKMRASSISVVGDRRVVGVSGCIRLMLRVGLKGQSFSFPMDSVFKFDIF